MKKYTTEPLKVHLNSVMETIRNHSIMKITRQIQENLPSFEKLQILEKLLKLVSKKSRTNGIISRLVPHKGCLNTKITYVNNVIYDYC